MLFRVVSSKLLRPEYPLINRTGNRHHLLNRNSVLLREADPIQERHSIYLHQLPQELLRVRRDCHIAQHDFLLGGTRVLLAQVLPIRACLQASHSTSAPDAATVEQVLQEEAK